MKEITVSIPDEVYQRAQARAAELGRSLNALVADYLKELFDREADFSRLESLQHSVQAEIATFRGGNRLERGMVHNRALR